ncbi:MAG: hypothetical protein WC298_04210, partial [Sideroxydans sp.]
MPDFYCRARLHHNHLLVHRKSRIPDFEGVLAGNYLHFKEGRTYSLLLSVKIYLTPWLNDQSDDSWATGS